MKKTTKLGTVAGLAALAAGAYYFYYSKNAKKHRAAVKGWMEKAEKEIIEEALKLKDAALNEENYKAIVSTVTEKYRVLQKLGTREAEDFRDALQKAWKTLKKDLSKKRRS